MESGSFRWRKIPYGYKWDESRSNIVPDERTAGYVRNIFQWKLDGLSVTAILDRLEEAKDCSSYYEAVSSVIHYFHL